MGTKRVWGFSVATLITVGLMPVAAPPAPVSASGDIEGVVYRLMSSDARWEESGEAQWVLETEDGLTEVATSDGEGLRSGTVHSFSDDPRSRHNVSAASVAAAPVIGRVQRAKVKPNRSLLVVPVEWAGASWTPADTSTATEIAAEIAPWWNAMSARREVLSIRILDPVVLGSDVAAGTCEYRKMSAAVKDRIEELGLKADHIMAALPGANMDCSFGGLGMLGGNFTWTYTRKGYGYVWAHELGHNLGLPHANLCFGEVALSYLASCEDLEYGNTMDVMGVGVPVLKIDGARTSYESRLTGVYFSPSLLDAIGWLPAQNRTDWTGGSTTVTLVRPDRTDLGVTAVKLPALEAQSGDNELWLQYNPHMLAYGDATRRAPFGGVMITMEPSEDFEKNRMRGGKVPGSAGGAAYLCDLTPLTGMTKRAIDFTTDPRLSAGQSWTEPRGRFTIAVVSADGTSATVTISPIGQPAVGTPIGISVVPDTGGRTMVSATVAAVSTGVGTGEPVWFDMSVVESPDKTCTVAAVVGTCTFSGLQRLVSNTVRVTSRTGPATASADALPVVLPATAPVLDVSFDPADTTVVATVSVDDGGSPLTRPATLTFGASVCEIPGPGPTTCTFTDLPRRSAVEFASNAANAIGERTTVFKTRTESGPPDAPVVTARVKGRSLVVSVAPRAADVSNVDDIVIFCDGRYARSMDKSPEDFVDGKAVFTFKRARGETVFCEARLLTISPKTENYFASNSTVVRVASNNKVKVGKIAVTPKVVSTKKGRVAVSWKTFDSFGGPVAVTVRTSKKSCRRTSARTCTVSRLASGSVLTVVVTASGRAGRVVKRVEVTVR